MHHVDDRVTDPQATKAGVEGTMEALVLPLHSSEATLTTAGGKGANLSQLARAGFPVPSGFLVSTAAYWAFVQANGLQPQIVARARSGAGTDFEDASAAIRQLFERASIPSQVATAIQQAYAALCPEGKAPTPLAVRSSCCTCLVCKCPEDGEAPIQLAVRSSATAEDLPGASFAGQQETYLNVRGEQDVLQAVKQCWSSLWMPRALAYRARQASIRLPSASRSWCRHWFPPMWPACCLARTHSREHETRS